MQNIEKINLNAGIVHDWMVSYTGAEQVVENIASLFDQATIYTLLNFLSDDEILMISSGHKIQTSYLNRLPGVKNYYRYLLNHFTQAIEAFDVRSHDLIISNSTSVAKGVLTSTDQIHIAYIHTPARYAWDLSHDYIKQVEGSILKNTKAFLINRMMHKFRIWDQRTIPLIDKFVANSNFIARRIQKIYGKQADVIYPPVDTNKFLLNRNTRGDYFIAVSRLVPYKRVDLIVETFNNRPDLKLKVIGTGPQMQETRAKAGKNIEILGYVDDDVLLSELQNARAFIFAAIEDFGIAPLEAQSCGTPVIALGYGGTAETVVDHKSKNTSEATGVHFQEQTTSSLSKALDEFLAIEKDLCIEYISEFAKGFSRANFRQNFTNLINQTMNDQL